MTKMNTDDTTMGDDLIAQVERLLEVAMEADMVEIKGDDVYMIKGGVAVHYIADDKLKRVLSGTELDIEGDWQLLAPGNVISSKFRPPDIA
jgi:hypothetical protein